jgi:CHAT domain-containing protein
LEVQQGNYEQAAHVCAQEILGIERFSQSIRHEDLRVNFRAQWRRAFDHCVITSQIWSQRANSQEAFIEAFEISNQMRAQELLNNMRSTISVPASASFAEEVLRSKLSSSELSDKRDINRQWEEIRRQVRATAGDNAPAQLSISFADVVQRLPEDTTVIQYHLADQYSFAWVFFRPKGTRPEKTQIAVVNLPDRSDVLKAVEELMKYTESPNTRPDDASWNEYLRSNRKVRSMLLDPLAPALPATNWVIVPDDGLFRLPFGSLEVPASDRKDPATADTWVPAVLSRIIRISPAVSTAFRDVNPQWYPEKKPVMVLGDPVLSPLDNRIVSRPNPNKQKADSSLPRADYASRVVNQTFGTTCQPVGACALPRDGVANFGVAARRSALQTGDLSKFGVLAFMTHAENDSSDGNQSHVWLSRFDNSGVAVNEQLNVIDVYSLRLFDNLVFLGSCSGACGPISTTEGTMSLARAFLYAGARQVVAAGWSVDQLATEFILSSTLDSIVNHGQTAAVALTLAQRAIFKDPSRRRWQAPYYWSAFQTFGDGRY